ncbi:MAG TPA: M48 family metalloprotease [Rudaea sp.]|nr:M48 family metalloprotease [Rudaea sp.]
MILSYSLRLLFLCLASFFLLHALAGVAAWLAERPAIRLAEGASARSAARFLFWMRILPPGIALAFVAGVCVPSYLRYESNLAGEEVGFVCMALAVLGFLVWAFALARGLRAAIHSLQFERLCRRTGSTMRLAGEPSQMLVVEAPHAFLVQSGVLRPRIVISQPLLAGLSGAELDAALRHERAHWAFRDNGKRLLFAFLPEILPVGQAYGAIERAWAKVTERAADDLASASGPQEALLLAAALVRLARLRGDTGMSTPLARASSSLAGLADDDLRGRIERLLAPGPAASVREPAYTRILWGAAGVLAAGALALLASPALLSSVHEVLERLVN